MNKIILSVATIFLASALSIEAQQPANVHRIGYLAGVSFLLTHPS
jgi:hypothetical protein